MHTINNKQISNNGFHKVPDIPELLTSGKEKEYLSSFYKGLAYNPYAITQADIDEFVSHYSAPGGMRAGFEYYRAFSQDAEDNKESAANGKLTIPVLVLSGDIYPALGGDLPGSTTLKATQALAENVTGVTSSTFRTLDSRRATTICYWAVVNNKKRRLVERNSAA